MSFQNQPQKPIEYDKNGVEVRKAKNIRFSSTEWEAIVDAANAAGQPPCTYVRNAALSLSQIAEEQHMVATQTGLRSLGWGDED